MTKQITIRLPDELVTFIDQVVERGHGASRAGVVARALDRERRRQIAARDAAILAGVEPDQDLDDLAAHAVRTPMDDLD